MAIFIITRERIELDAFEASVRIKYSSISLVKCIIRYSKTTK